MLVVIKNLINYTENIPGLKKLRSYLFFSISIAVFLLSACTSHKELVYLQETGDVPPEHFYPTDQPEYKIQNQDVLYIKVLTLNQEVSDLVNSTPSYSSNLFTNEASLYIYGYDVSDSGYVEIPVIGKVEVAGKTISQAKQAIQEKSNIYLKDATVILKLISFKYSVFGEVLRPGVYYNYNNQLTVLEAISMAGNLTDFGNREKITVIRPTRQGTQTFRLDLSDKNILTSEGFFLLPNDIVYVEPTKGKSFRVNIPTFSLLLSSVSTFILLLNFISIQN